MFVIHENHGKQKYIVKVDLKISNVKEEPFILNIQFHWIRPNKFTAAIGCYFFSTCLTNMWKCVTLDHQLPNFRALSKSPNKNRWKKTITTTRPLGPMGYGGYRFLHLIRSAPHFIRTFVARPSDQTFTEEEMTSTFLKSRFVTWEFCCLENNLEG